MLKIHVLLLTLLPLATSGAQSQASITESRLISVKDGGSPDTVNMRTISTGRRTRTEMSGPGTRSEPWRTIGTTQISILSDSTMTATYIDTAKKSYWTMDLGSMMRSFQKFTDVRVQPETRPRGFTLDSLGDGGTISGYRTIHFRAHSTSRMTMNLTGQPITGTNVQTTDYYAAPGLQLDSQHDCLSESTDGGGA